MNQPLGREMFDAAKVVLASASCKNEDFMVVELPDLTLQRRRGSWYVVNVLPLYLQSKQAVRSPTDKFLGIRMMSKQTISSAHSDDMLAKRFYSLLVGECSPSAATAVEGLQNEPW